MEYKFTISVPKFKSHQHSNNFTRYGAYKKPANALYEGDIINQLRNQFVSKYGYKALSGCISLSITYFVKIPTTLKGVRLKANERRELAGEWANVKPDNSNINKTIEDCIERAKIIDDDVNIVKYDDIQKVFNDDPNDKYEHAVITLTELPKRKDTN